MANSGRLWKCNVAEGKNKKRHQRYLRKGGWGQHQGRREHGNVKGAMGYVYASTPVMGQDMPWEVRTQTLEKLHYFYYLFSMLSVTLGPGLPLVIWNTLIREKSFNLLEWMGGWMEGGMGGKWGAAGEGEGELGLIHKMKNK